MADVEREKECRDVKVKQTLEGLKKRANEMDARTNDSIKKNTPYGYRMKCELEKIRRVK